MNLDVKIIENIVINAIQRFNEKENYLLRNGVSERSVCSKLAHYLEIELGKNIVFNEYSVDTEYNRGYDGDDSRSKELDGVNITLDIAIHKRGYDSHGIGYDNLACFEMKKVGNKKGYREDENRLQKLTDLTGKFCYKIGFMLRFSVKKEKIDVKSVFINGQRFTKLDAI